MLYIPLPVWEPVSHSRDTKGSSAVEWPGRGVFWHTFLRHLAGLGAFLYVPSAVSFTRFLAVLVRTLRVSWQMHVDSNGRAYNFPPPGKKGKMCVLCLVSCILCFVFYVLCFMPCVL